MAEYGKDAASSRTSTRTHGRAGVYSHHTFTSRKAVNVHSHLRSLYA